MGVLNAGYLLPRRGEERRKDRKNKTCIIGWRWILKMGGTEISTCMDVCMVQLQLCPDGTGHKGNRVHKGCLLGVVDAATDNRRPTSIQTEHLVCCFFCLFVFFTQRD